MENHLSKIFDEDGYKFTLHTSRGKKIWIMGYKLIEQINEDEFTSVNAMLELNVVDKNYKINWLLYRDNKDNWIESIDSNFESKLIDRALAFAKNNNYLDRIYKKYKID